MNTKKLNKVMNLLTAMVVGIVLTLVVQNYNNPTASSSGSMKVLLDYGNIEMQGDIFIYHHHNNQFAEVELKALAKLSENYSDTGVYIAIKE